YDGLHLIPDHQLLKRMGVASQQEGRVVVHTPFGDYQDYPVLLGGSTTEPGYLLAATYREREIAIQLGDPLQIEYKPVSECTPCGFSDMDLYDLGPKFDGVFHELEVKDQQAYMVERAGKQRIGSVEGFEEHLCLHLEELEKAYVLLRVVSFRGYVPPHCGDSLRAFLSRVKMKINQKPVCPSPKWRHGHKVELTDPWTGCKFKAPVDGVISRKDGRDYYCKYQWTVDLFEHALESLTARLRAAGLTLEWQPNAGLCEYGVSRELQVVKLVFLRQRLDKTKPTTLDTVMYLLQLPTLQEMQALS
ncbi:hypothetical protein, partial [Leptospira sp. Pond_2020]|uniref:hypothetical protein n=1 Tax=Leptospira sp. Pond_2020 TaxID=2846916 RepID=UPI001E2CF2D7